MPFKLGWTKSADTDWECAKGSNITIRDQIKIYSVDSANLVGRRIKNKCWYVQIKIQIM